MSWFSPQIGFVIIKCFNDYFKNLADRISGKNSHYFSWDLGYSLCLEGLQTDLVLLHLALLHFANAAFSINWKFCGNLAWSKSTGAIFPSTFAHFMSLCHIWWFLKYFKLFHYYYVWYGDLRSVVFGVTIAKRLQLAEGSDDG